MFKQEENAIEEEEEERRTKKKTPKGTHLTFIRPFNERERDDANCFRHKSSLSLSRFAAALFRSNKTKKKTEHGTKKEETLQI